MIMERNYQPVIIFAFSKRECEALGQQMARLDFNTGTASLSLFVQACVAPMRTMLRRAWCSPWDACADDEKKMVETVFKNAIDSLSEDDRSLPQIEAILPVRWPHCARTRPHRPKRHAMHTPRDVADRQGVRRGSLLTGAGGAEQLLKQGVGIHHGGLLPILKEVIEILFQEGLIKVRAAPTWVGGIDSPARWPCTYTG